MEVGASPDCEDFAAGVFPPGEQSPGVPVFPDFPFLLFDAFVPIFVSPPQIAICLCDGNGQNVGIGR